ncbi:MAG: MBL fold metallo-hydrolase [Butyrivibrio sp.]|nr:MBL fold metallo-hydrolase [Butyrivibrio sp.]
MAAALLYQGHGSVRIVTGEGKVIYIDPFMGDGYDLPADLILMTHGHYDHTQDKLIKKRNTGCTVIKWSDALKKGEYKNYDYGFVSIETVEAGYNKNHNVKECVGFILTFSDGVKAYFSGDTSTTPSMAGFAEKKLDYAFLCCDGVYNMNVSEASKCSKTIGAKHTIPYHMEPVKDNSGFDINVAERFDAPGKIILKPGEELVLQ